MKIKSNTPPRPYTWQPTPPAGTTEIRGWNGDGETIEYTLKRGQTVTFFTETGKIEAAIDSTGQLRVRADGGRIIIVPDSSNSVNLEARKS